MSETEPRLSAIFPALSIPARLHGNSNVNGKGVCLALIDSGFVPHPDLMNPRVRIRRYFDAVEDREGDLPPHVEAFYTWHGTMTACTAAGNGYLSRMLYTSLAGEAEVVLVRTMNPRGRIPTSVIVRALQWCLLNHRKLNIRVINLSVYADEIDPRPQHPVTELVEELYHEGVITVAAAGNDAAKPLRPPALSPAAITVGGLDDGNTLASRDNRMYNSSFGVTVSGQRKPEVIAPAIWLPAPMLLDTPTQIEAAVLCALDALPDAEMNRVLPDLIGRTKLDTAILTLKDTAEKRTAISQRLVVQKIISPYYQHVDGTSFAAPIVASLIAQMLEVNPGLKPETVKNILTGTAEILPQVDKRRQGYGVVNPKAALAQAIALR